MTTHAPVIGISGMNAESKSVQAMISRVQETNAIPILFANHAKRKAADDIHKCDAVIVMGNNYDIDPELYIHRYPKGHPYRIIHPSTNSTTQSAAAKARAHYEQELIVLAIKQKMPLFAICGGMQTINIMCGGTLHQHIPELIGHDTYNKNAGLDGSNTVVSIAIVPDTMLARVIQEKSLQAMGGGALLSSEGAANAFHHQSVHWIGEGLIASAHSDAYTDVHDGSEERLIEAIEPDPNGAYADQFLIGVQWHPEFLEDDTATDKILRDLQQEAIAYAQTHGHEHSPEQIKMENVLSALPILKGISDYTKTPTTGFNSRGKPKGFGR